MVLTVNGERQEAAATYSVTRAARTNSTMRAISFAVAVNHDVVKRARMERDPASRWRPGRRLSLPGRAAEGKAMQLYGENIQSRLLIGTALYPSPAVMEQALKTSGAEIVTVSLRREAAGGKAGDAFWR